jgi:SAM-dependent methyltransferase
VIGTFLRRLLGRSGESAPVATGLPYWEQRAQQHGARSVLDIRHSEEEVTAVTDWQKSILFPHLQRKLRGDERLVLDFGCGPGRFTVGLAELARCRGLGVDPIQSLLDLAPAHPAVEYRRLEEGRIPVEDHVVDVVWICLVLGTITEEKSLRASVAEIERVLRPGGILFLVENTARKKDRPHFRYRSIAEYRSLFPSSHLEHLGDYYDKKERISILAGNRL